jgi:hypothetical protein
MVSLAQAPTPPFETRLEKLRILVSHPTDLFRGAGFRRGTAVSGATDSGPIMKRRTHKTAKAKRPKNVPPPGKATNAIPPPDDPLRRVQQESDLNTREMAEKRQEALNKIRESSSSSERSKP